MDSEVECVPSVVHVGVDATLVRNAVDRSPMARGAGSVASVGDDASAVANLDTDPISVIVCEVESGVERLDRIRRASPDRPCLAVVPDTSHVDAALDAGAADVFVRREDIDEETLLGRRIDGLVHGREDVASRLGSVGALIDAIDDSFYVLDTDGVLRGWNRRFREVTGYTDAELQGMHAREFFVGDDRARIEAAIDDVVDSGSTVVEAELVAKDGTRTPIEYTGRLVVDADGTPRRIVGIGRDVTERRERNDRLLRLRQTIETITDNVPLALFEVGPEGTVLSMRTKALSDRAPFSSASGDDIDDLFRDRPRVRDALRQGLDGEAVNRLVDFDGAIVELWLQPLLDESGTVDRVVGLALDVTEREERAKLLDQIQENAGEVIWMSTPGKESMDFITEAYADVWGRSPARLRENPTSFVDAIHPDDRPRVEAALAEQRDTPDAYEETYRVVRPDGAVRWVHDRASGVYENGQLERIVGVASDITERKEREQELELKNRAIETAPIGIAIHDTMSATDPIVYANEEFLSLTGHDDTDLDGEQLSVLAGSGTDPERLETITSALDHDDGASSEIVLYRADGTPFWGRVDVAPVSGDESSPTHAVSFLQDITETKEHQQEVERHLTEFGSVLAEDLSVPLRNAQDQLRTAANGDGGGDIERATRSIERAASLVEDLTEVHSFSVKSRTMSESITQASEGSDGDDE